MLLLKIQSGPASESALIPRRLSPTQKSASGAVRAIEQVLGDLETLRQAIASKRPGYQDSTLFRGVDIAEDNLRQPVLH
jgi:hypothetical protein